MENDSPYVSVALFRAVLAAGQSAGLDPLELLREIDATPDLLEDPDAFLSGALEEALWEAIVARTDGADLGVRAAQSLARGQFRGLEYLLRASASFGEGLERLVRFGAVLHGRPIFALDRGPEQAWIVYESPHDPSRAFTGVAAELALACVFAVGEKATTRRWNPRLVSLIHDRKSVESLEAFFGAPVRTNQPRYEIELDAALLEQPMAEADSELRDIVERYVQSLLAGAPEARPYAEEVRRRIIATLPTEPSLEDVASSMGRSARRLQALLLEEETSFRRELEDLREHLARRLLSRPELRVVEVATGLGYSDATAFHRAFKRWTGLTPGEFRRKARET